MSAALTLVMPNMALAVAGGADSTTVLPLPARRRRGDALRSGMGDDTVSDDTQSDEQLAVAMFDGDDSAAQALLTRYRVMLFGMLMRMMRNRDDAEELFQETFVRALRASHQYDRKRRFKPWLFTIAANLARDRLSRAGHPAAPLLTSDGELPEPRKATRESAEAIPLARHDLARALDGLSDNHREVVLLRYFEDLDEREIAEIAGIPRGTVKSRLHHAMRKMRELLRGPTNDA